MPLAVGSFLAGCFTEQTRPREQVCLGGGRLVAGSLRQPVPMGHQIPGWGQSFQGAGSAPGGDGWGSASMKTNRTGPHTQRLREAQDVHSQVST